jgi:hypothetical protein
MTKQKHDTISAGNASAKIKLFYNDVTVHIFCIDHDMSTYMMQLFCDILLRVFSTKCGCLLECTCQILNPLFASSLSVQVLSYQLQ